MPIPYQYEFNNFLFGAGTQYVVESVKGIIGWDGSSRDTPSDVDHGSTPGMLTMNPRVIEVVIKVDSVKGVVGENCVRALKAAFAPPRRNFSIFAGDFESRGFYVDPRCKFFFYRPGWTERHVSFARVTKFSIVSDFDTGSGFIVCNVQLTAPDPVVYGETIHVFGGGSWTQEGDHPDGYLPRVVTGGTTITRSAGDGTQTVSYSENPGELDIDFRTRFSKPLGSGLKITDDDFFAILPGTQTLSGGDFYIRSAWL